MPRINHDINKIFQLFQIREEEFMPATIIAGPCSEEHMQKCLEKNRSLIADTGMDPDNSMMYKSASRPAEMFIINRSANCWSYIAKKTQCAQCNRIVLGSDERKLFKCSKCRMISYCDQICQRADWKRHKKHCKMFQDDPSLITGVRDFNKGTIKINSKPS